jgi:hypothetical protein
MSNPNSTANITKEEFIKSLNDNNYDQSLTAKDLGISNTSVSRLMYWLTLLNI